MGLRNCGAWIGRSEPRPSRTPGPSGIRKPVIARRTSRIFGPSWTVVYPRPANSGVFPSPEEQKLYEAALGWCYWRNAEIYRARDEALKAKKEKSA